MEPHEAITDPASLRRGRHALEVGPGTLRVGVATAHRSGVPVDPEVPAPERSARRRLDDTGHPADQPLPRHDAVLIDLNARLLEA
jgi:hypothetical protein